MTFKNSVKLLAGNFSLVWKVFLYKFIVVLISAGLILTCFNVFSNLGAFENFKASFLEFLYSYNISSSPANTSNLLWGLFQSVGDLLAELISAAPFVFIFMMFIILIVLPFLWHLSDVPTSEVNYAHMSSQVKVPFVRAFFEKLNLATKHSILLTLALIPFNIIVLGGVILGVYVSSLGGVAMFVGPAIIYVWLTIVYSLRITVTCCWTAIIVCKNQKVIRSFLANLRIVSSRFFRTWSNCVIASVLVLCLLSMLGLFGYLIVLPIASVFIVTFGLVSFFVSQGLRFYSDFDTIVTPKADWECERMGANISNRRVFKLRNIL